jgi:hypothetical protein
MYRKIGKAKDLPASLYVEFYYDWVAFEFHVSELFEQANTERGEKPWRRASSYHGIISNYHFNMFTLFGQRTMHYGRC